MMRLPNFLIIGAQKSATRWLRQALGDHQSIFTAERELEFFNHNFHRGLKWYVQQFKESEGEPYLGEATPGYMFWRERPDLQAARIDGLLQDVRLIALLRNPMDRARSAFIHHLRRGRIEPGTDLLSWVQSREPHRDRWGIVSGGWYASSLEPYRVRFSGRLLVLLHDDVETKPNLVYDQAITHIGLTPGVYPPGLFRKVHSGEDRLTHDSPQEPVLSSKERARSELYHLFEDEILGLESEFALDLSHWKPE